nr:hypothetical protein [Rhizobium laguerreae]
MTISRPGRQEAWLDFLRERRNSRCRRRLAANDGIDMVLDDRENLDAILAWPDEPGRERLHLTKLHCLVRVAFKIVTEKKFEVSTAVSLTGRSPLFFTMTV